MMDFIRQNFEAFVIGLFAIVIVLLGVVISYSHFFSRHFSNRKFQIRSRHQVNALDKNSRFTITIYNNNINDTRVSGFGFVYKRQNIDYYKTYLNAKQLQPDAKIVIPSRDYIETELNVEDLKVIVRDINRGRFNVAGISVFVTDSLGMTTRANASAIRVSLRRMLAEDERVERARVSAVHRQHMLDRRVERGKRRFAARQIRKAAYDRIVLWFRMKFAKK